MREYLAAGAYCTNPCSKRKSLMQQSRSPFHEGLAAAERGDFARADAIARTLLARDPNDVHALQIVGFSAFRQGRTKEALEAFWSANRIEPGQPAILYWMGVLYKDRGDFEQAARALREATRLNPGYGEAWCHLGETLYYTARKDEARSAFERAVAAEPNSPVVLARAARFFEATHDLARARSHAEAAAKIDPKNEIAKIALFEVDLREKRFEDVIKGATEILERGSATRRNQARLHHIAASAHDRLGNYETAFSLYESANQLQAELDHDAARRTPSPLHIENLDRVIRFLSENNISHWAEEPPFDGAAPVFLVGFVRSGTTWLDQILSSHPRAVVMEEEDNFVDIWPHLATSEAGLNKLLTLSRAEIASFRDIYWRRANQTLNASARNRLVVDKVPLNTAQLALIHRLFPDAKILFAIRDPRDAVLSAFQQHFQINVGMLPFLDIVTAAQFYDRVMTIGSLVRRKARLDLSEVRYEALVADFESEIRKIISFLGLEWDDAVLDYRKTAAKRAIRTPSVRQVVEKPYATSIGKWRNYREGMASALPILAPWVQKFGYPAD